MEATVKIDGKDVRFKATAAVPLLYRRRFNRDLLRDLREVAAAVREGRGGLSLQDLTIFENLAYIMAKHAEHGGAGGK